VFTAFTSQQEVFESTAAPLVEDCLLGFAATIFAYGQTGTGKSFTMQGELHNPDKWGIMPRSAHLIFDSLANSERFESSRVTVSYLEIYNEELFDLLVPPDVPEASRVKLRVVEDKSPEGRGIYCNGLIEKPVTSAEDILEALSLAEERRAVEETKMNAQSSRSHCLFSITVTAREYCADGAGGMVMERTGRLNLVDLAGSESAKTAGAGNEQRGLERKNINQSLLALGRVITALQSLSASKLTGVDLAGRVPYRDSKLTRLLQDALGGRSKTTIVATCSPSELAVEETVSTLGYAQRASGRPTNLDLRLQIRNYGSHALFT
jgi:kinesin family protein 11